MTGYKRYYDESKKKFIADDFKTEIIGDCAHDFIEGWYATQSGAEESAYYMNINVVSIEDLRKTTDMSRFAICLCKECHKPFGLTLEEYWWFEDKGLSTPKRCPCCRKKRK